jgi:hypothetical protein
MIEAWPIYLIASRALKPDTAEPSLWVLAPPVSLVAALAAVAVVGSIRLGLKSLESMRE